MLDIMKNSRLYKFLRKIAGDEVSITPSNVLEDCLDDIAEAMGEGGEGMIRLSGSSLTEDEIAAIVANPGKYYYQAEGSNYIERVAVVAGTSIVFASSVPINSDNGANTIITIHACNRATGVITQSYRTTGHTDNGVTALANAAIDNAFTAIPENSIPTTLVTLLSNLQSNIVQSVAISGTGNYTLIGITDTYKHPFSLPDDKVPGLVGCSGYAEKCGLSEHIIVYTPDLGTIDIYLTASNYTGYMYAIPL